MPTPTQDLPRPHMIAKLGEKILREQIEPRLSGADTGKYVAIAVDNADYEVDKNDFEAVTRLLARHPSAEVWLGRAGSDAATRTGPR